MHNHSLQEERDEEKNQNTWRNDGQTFPNCMKIQTLKKFSKYLLRVTSWVWRSNLSFRLPSPKDSRDNGANPQVRAFLLPQPSHGDFHCREGVTEFQWFSSPRQRVGRELVYLSTEVTALKRKLTRDFPACNSLLSNRSDAPFDGICEHTITQNLLH